MDLTAERRLSAISGHLQELECDGDAKSLFSLGVTAGEFVNGQGYSVVLPEKLQTGKWNVYSEQFRDYKCLGTKFVQMVLWGYKWMTYGETCTSRSAMGSGLIYHDIPKSPDAVSYIVNHASIQGAVLSHENLIANSGGTSLNMNFYPRHSPKSLFEEGLREN
ncbi:hypothetical protein HPP92_010651 [Vanilla planifolia]|uniref:Uncharacterized protein n=1 Tax=Vanilla planifolia TaxID=51239 RepID=A0A835R4I5_VANPL|nr:hypothetical protein HPP92_010651 [Vanilla planifolia]